MKKGHLSALALAVVFACHSRESNKSTNQHDAHATILPATGSASEPSTGDLLGVGSLRLSREELDDLRQDKALDSATIRALDPSAQLRLARDERHPDHPGEAVKFRLLQEGVHTPVPKGAIERAIVSAKSLRAPSQVRLPDGLPSGPLRNLYALQPPEAGLSRPGWRTIRSGAIGGRTRAVLVQDATGDHLLVASPAGGIWRTSDAGKTWAPADDFMANLAVSTIAASPHNPSVIFAGTGEGYYNSDAIRGAGIFRSDDGGKSWAQVRSASGFAFVNRIAVSADGKTVLAATPGGIQRSGDGGQTWEAVQTAGYELFDVKFEYGGSKNAVAAGRGVVVVTRDGGTSWKESNGLPDGSGRIEIAYAAAAPHVVYASVDANRGAIYRSSDGGETFELRNSGANYLGKQGWYSNVIWAGDPTDSDFVIVGGVDLWKSKDGGRNIARVSLWANDKAIHADQHAVASGPGFDGVRNRTVWIGNDGGVYRVTDVKSLTPESGWDSLNHDYGATQFYSVAVSPTTGTLVGGTQDNGTLRYSTTDGWTTMFGGDGGYVQVSRDGVFYGEYVNLNIHRSTDDGKTSDYISGQYWDDTQRQWVWRAPPYLIDDAKDESANFISPFVVIQEQRATILAGGISLWRTRDADAVTPGPKWVRISEPTASSSPISAIAVGQSDENVVWLCHNDGSIYASRDASVDSPHWTRLDAAGKLPREYCHHIEFDSAHSNTVFITFGAYSNHNVWQTQDAGKSWSEIGTGLPPAPVRSITTHPTKRNYLYVATDVGVFGTENGGRKWSATNEGPTSCAVDGFVWVGGTLFAATHGRGIFSIVL